MPILPDQINLAEIAYQQHLEDEEKEIQARIVKARELEAGYFDSDLATELQRSLLGGSENDLEGVNMISVALNTLLRRVSLQAVTAGSKEQTQWLQRTFKANRLLKTQRDLHRPAVRDGESFLIVDYDLFAPRPWEEGGRGMPRFFVYERYTSPNITYGDGAGSGQGCKAHYRNGDANQPLEMVSMRWPETIYEDGEPVTAQRMTLYIAQQPNTAARIEKYKMDDAGEWRQHSDQVQDEAGELADETWPIWWTDDQTETGESLPLLAFHFRNEEMQPAFKRAWGLQIGMDHMFASLLSGTTLTGHQLLVALGFFPTTDGKEPADDGSNLMVLRPRQIIGTTKTKTEADVKHIPPADPRAILDSMDKVSIYFALVTGLPLKNFTFTRQVSSGEALRHGEVELVALANELSDLFEPEWIAAFSLARKLDNLYGASWDEAEEITLQWAPKETVSQEVKKDEVDSKLAAGVPGDVIQADVFGYSQEEIEKNKAAQNGADQNAAGETAVPGEVGA